MQGVTRVPVSPSRKTLVSAHYCGIDKGYYRQLAYALLVLDTQEQAIWRRGKPSGVVHHSDRGSQYSQLDTRIV